MPILHNRKAIIVFDIHGVLFKTDYVALVKLMVSNKATLSLMAHVIRPTILKELFHLYRSDSITEQYYVHLMNHYPKLAHCSSLLIGMSNAQRPIMPVIRLVQQLKSLGFTLHILSNIGPLFFAELAQQHQAFFALFDKIKIAGPHDNYIAKPHLLMYERYFHECNPDNNPVILIDNDKRNIAAAYKSGITGLRYETPELLKCQLQRLLPLE